MADPRSPRVVLDAMFFQITRTGIARVWQSLLRHWAGDAFGEHLLVLDRGGSAPRFDGLRYRRLPLYDYRLTGDDARMLQEVCDGEGADVFVSSYYTTPLTTPTVFVAYDMIPEVFRADLDAPMWREKRFAIRHAAAHVAISHSTARDLARLFPDVAADKVTVAYPGVEEVFHPASAEERAALRARYGVGKPYFLLVGSRAGFNGYKNAELFFRAFARLPGRAGYAVLCVGGEPELEAPLRALAGDADVRVLSLSDEELRAAYSEAAALVYPSRYEGFGLPVLEALACGCPVVTCRNSSLVEVAGGAALYVSETDADELAAALRHAERPEVRATLTAAGLSRAKQFTWRAMAETMADVLRRTADDAGRGPAVWPADLWRDFRGLQAAAQQHEAARRTLQQTEHELRQTRGQLEAAELELQYLRQCRQELAESQALCEKQYWELRAARTLIAHMEASKFWKARAALARSKKVVLSLASHLLPRRAAG